MQDIDRIAEANAHLDRRARQREAAALALLEANTPEAIAAEKERQARALEESLPSTNDMIDAHYAEEAETSETLQEKLAGALQPVVDGDGDDSEGLIGLGRLVFQWALAENDVDYELAIQIQVDDQPPAGFVADITPDLLATWAKGKGLQGNRTEHKHFAAGLFDRALAVGATETANHLIYLLEDLMLRGEPTKTSVGEDDYFGPGEDDLILSPERLDLVEPSPELSE